MARTNRAGRIAFAASAGAGLGVLLRRRQNRRRRLRQALTGFRDTLAPGPEPHPPVEPVPPATPEIDEAHAPGHHHKPPPPDHDHRPARGRLRSRPWMRGLGRWGEMHGGSGG